jgi:hypothetical protein
MFLQMLGELKDACRQNPPDELAILLLIQRMLVALRDPENNTDRNCKAIDLFIMLDILNPDPPATELPDNFPPRVREILEGMGGELHDTHTAPKIAKGCRATPDQLLEQTQLALAQVRAGRA